MIMGHVGFGALFSKIIHVFHMPMFFFVSGFFYKDCISWDDLKKRITYKTKSLLIPYFVFSSISYLFDAMLNGLRPKPPILFIFNTYGAGFPISGAVWFLTALLICEIVYITLDCIFRYGSVLHAAAIIIAICGNLLGAYSSIKLPFGLSAAMVGIGFFHIARVVAKEARFDRLCKLTKIEVLMILLAGTVLGCINSNVNLRLGLYGIPPLFWFSSLLIILGLWNACRLLDVVLCKYYWYPCILNIGYDSIVYLCLNQLVIFIINALLKIFTMPLVVNHFICLFITMILLEPLRIVFTKTKLRVLIGKQN
jgi:fucose 4-O-acetylase-like acetyltransferase